MEQTTQIAEAQETTQQENARSYEKPILLQHDEWKAVTGLTVSV